MTYFSTYDYRNQGEAMLVLGYLSPAPPGPPDPVSDLTAAPTSDTSITLTFTPVMDATSYEYRVDGGSWVPCDDTSGTQVVGSLTANTSYDFEVRGHNDSGYSDPSNTASATTYTAEAVALFARMTTPPTSTRAGLINTCIASLISGGVWAKLDALWVQAAADSQAAKLNWISSSFTLSAVNSPTFTTDRGYAGNGSTSYLNTNFIPSSDGVNFTQDNASMFCWLNAGTDTADGSASIMGAFDGTQGSYLYPRNGTDALQARFNDGTTSAFGGLTVSTRYGLTLVQRTSSTSKIAYRNTIAATAVTVTSIGRPTRSVFLSGRNSSGTPAGLQNNRFAAAGLGASLSGAEQTALFNALNTYLTAIGGN